MTYDDWKTRAPDDVPSVPDVSTLNPAQLIVYDCIQRINDEVVASLQDIDFVNDKDWREALDIAGRYIRWSILSIVEQGSWADAGITELSQLDDLQIVLRKNGDSVHISIHMPKVMQILREQDDPGTN